MRHLAPILALLLSFSLHAQTPRFGQDIAVGPVEYGDPGAARFGGDIATDGSGYLAVWSDTRSGNVHGVIYAARLSADGTLLDHTGIVIGNGQFAEVVWTAESWVVAWLDGYTTRIASVSREGVIGRQHALGPFLGLALALATNGKSVMLVTSGRMLFRFNLDLTLHSTTVTGAITDAPNSVAITASGDQYLLALRSGPTIVTQTVDASGGLSAPSRISDSLGVTMVATASDGTNYLVLWSNEINELRGQYISPSNQEVGQARVLTENRAVRDGGVHAPSVVWRGNEFLSTYLVGHGFISGMNAEALRLGPGIEPVGSPAAFARISQSEPANLIAKSDGSGAAIWIDGGRVRVGLFDAVSLAAGAPFYKVVSVANAPRHQSRPAIVAVERTAVTAWREWSVDSPQVRVARLRGEPVVVAEEESVWVDVVYDGDTVSVLWRSPDVSQLSVRRYTRALEPIDAAPLRFAVPPGALMSSAAAGNGAIAVTWRVDGDYELGGANRFSVLVLQRSDPTLVATPLVVIDDSGDDNDSTVVWDGSRFAVVWRHDHSPDGMGNPPVNTRHQSIYVTHFTTNGVREEAQPLVAYDVTVSAIYSLRAAAHAGQLLLGWQEVPDSGPGDLTTLVARFDGTSRVTPRQLFSDRLLNWGLAALGVHDDGEVDVYWTRFNFSGFESGIRVQRVAPSLEPAGDAFVYDRFPVTQSPERASDTFWIPDLDATVAGNTAVFAYQRRGDEPGLGGVSRVFVRTEHPLVNRRRSVR
ncbi:MAG TPA: hypothetical protein VE974_29485 [Thermoanaerobaculia bacterium]|nr:hypothetical protein [Thermoanaerobaculia bacterium]